MRRTSLFLLARGKWFMTEGEFGEALYNWTRVSWDSRN